MMPAGKQSGEGSKLDGRSNRDNCHGRSSTAAIRATSTMLALATLGLSVGCSQHPLETARAQKHESSDQWMLRENKMAGQPDDVHFATKAQNTIDTPEGQTVPGMAIGCGGFGSTVIVTLGKRSVANGNVKISFDGAAPLTQKWDELKTGPSILTVPDDLEDDFLFRLTKAKTFEIEITPAGGTPQLATFKLRNIKELMSLENSCKSWLAAAHVNQQ